MSAINIAIDGYAGCGKSTLAHELAARLGYVFVDTGALYRALTLLALEAYGQTMEEKVGSVLKAAPQLTFSPENNHILVNGTDSETKIRDMRVAACVSEVAAMPAVRDFLKDVQRALIQRKGVVMEGRDIGTVIMPDAELKLFITATMEARVQRRMKQLDQEGKSATAQEVRKNLEDRDLKDATRAVAPLAKAEDAIAIDTTALDREGQLKLAIALHAPLVDKAGLLPYVS